MQENRYLNARNSFVIIFTGLYVFLRNSIPLLWTDSPRFAAFKYPISIKQSDSCNLSYFSSVFEFGSGGYRPIDELITKFGICSNNEFNNNTIPALFSGLIFSIMLVSTFRLTKYFIKTVQFRVLAIFLFVTIPPVLAASWNTFAGIQNLVILLTSKTICCYLELLTEYSRRNLIKFCFFAYLGTNYREYFFTVILVVILHQLTVFNVKKIAQPPIILVSLALLINWYYPRVVLDLIDNKNVTSRLDVGYFIAPEGTPGSSLLSFAEIKFTPLVKMFTIPLTFNIIIILVFVLLLMKIMITQSNLNTHLNFLPFLLLWILISLLPFLKVYTADVHLLYPLFPFIILGTSILEDLLNQLSSNLITYFAFVVLGLSSLSNLNLSLQTTIVISDNLQKISNLVENKTKSKSKYNIISNALSLEEVRYRLKGSFLPKWTIDQGIPFDPQGYSLGKYSDFLAYVEQNSKFGNKVFAGIFEHKYRVNKESFHKFPFTTDLQFLSSSDEYCHNTGTSMIKYRSTGQPIILDAQFTDFDIIRNLARSLVKSINSVKNLDNVYFPPDWVDDYGISQGMGVFSKYKVSQKFYLEELNIDKNRNDNKVNIFKFGPKTNKYGDFDKDFLSSTKYNSTFFESSSSKMEVELLVPKGESYFYGIVIGNKITPKRIPRELAVDYFDGQNRIEIPSTKSVENGNLIFSFQTKSGVSNYNLTFTSTESDILRISTIRGTNKTQIDCIVLP